jgi:hypothetical protein
VIFCDREFLRGARNRRRRDNIEHFIDYLFLAVDLRLLCRKFRQKQPLRFGVAFFLRRLFQYGIQPRRLVNRNRSAH